MTVVFSDVATARQLVRDASDPAIWSASAISLGGGVSMNVTLECANGEWTLRRVRYDTTGTLADVTYLAETTHCGTGQTVSTLIEPIEFSQTADADPFEIVFRAPAGSSEPASATVNMLQGEEPASPPTDWVEEHTCCTACPEGSPTFYIVDFGCPVVAGPESVADHQVSYPYAGLKLLAPRAMRLARDCLFGDDSCSWTARLPVEQFTGTADAGPGLPAFAILNPWTHLAEWKSAGLSPVIPCESCGNVIPFDEDGFDPRFDSYPPIVANETTGFAEYRGDLWSPGESVLVQRLDRGIVSAFSMSGCSVCNTGGVSTPSGTLDIQGVHSQGECAILTELSGIDSLDQFQFELPTKWWDLRVADDLTATLMFSGFGIDIVYSTTESWKCFGRNTLELTSVVNPTGLSATPPGKICIVPALSFRPPNPCETKEQQCACCDPGWDFITKLQFSCGGTLVTVNEVLPRTDCTVLEDGTPISAPCGCFKKTFTGTCVVDGADVSVTLVITIWCDGTQWKVAECCTIDGVTTCTTTLAAFDCVCSVASLGIEIGGGCCCLFQDEEPPPAPPDCTCTPPSTLYLDMSGCLGWEASGAVLTESGGVWSVFNPASLVDIFELRCVDGQWTARIQPLAAECLVDDSVAVNGTCDPFFLTFSLPISAGDCCAAGTATITFTISE